MTGARRLRNGLLRPWAVDYMLGLDEIQRLSREQGLSLGLDAYQTHALGQAIADQQEGQGLAHGQYQRQEPELSPELSKALDQVVAARARRQEQAQNQAQEQVQGQRPTPANRQARADRDGLTSAIDDGQGEHAGDAVQGDHVRNAKNDRQQYWERITRDYPDQDWS